MSTRENIRLIARAPLSSCCLVMVERHFLVVPRGCLQFVIVVFPDHTHYFCIRVDNVIEWFHLYYFCLCLLCVRVCLIIVAMWSPTGKRADLLALVGILGQVWYLIVSIRDLCTLSYFVKFQNYNAWRFWFG